MAWCLVRHPREYSGMARWNQPVMLGTRNATGRYWPFGYLFGRPSCRLDLLIPWPFVGSESGLAQLDTRLTAVWIPARRCGMCRGWHWLPPQHVANEAVGVIGGESPSSFFMFDLAHVAPYVYPRDWYCLFTNYPRQSMEIKTLRRWTPCVDPGVGWGRDPQELWVYHYFFWECHLTPGTERRSRLLCPSLFNMFILPFELTPLNGEKR